MATPAGIPTIRDSFQQTKEIALHCHNLRVGMFQWSKTTGKDIDKALFFTKQMVKDIVGLNFNPGETVPTFASAQRGISILTCRPKSAHEVKMIKDFEQARRATAHTAQFNKVRRLRKALPSPPPDNYFELRLSINTFCVLIWMLFGNKCDYYKGLLEVAKTLDQQEVHIICESFTADVCQRITWTILTDGRSFFNTILVESQFQQGERFRWLTSLIHKIMDDIRFAKAINRPMYPSEWLITAPVGQGMASGGMARGGYGGGNNKGGAQGNNNCGHQEQGRHNAGGGA